LINGLCDRALLTGYVNELKVIGADVIDEVARELPSLGNGELVTIRQEDVTPEDVTEEHAPS